MWNKTYFANLYLTCAHRPTNQAILKVRKHYCAWKWGCCENTECSVEYSQYNLLPHKTDYWFVHDGAWGNLALISYSLEPFLSQFVRVGVTCALVWGWKEKHVLWLAPGDKFVLLTDTKRDFRAVMKGDRCIDK